MDMVRFYASLVCRVPSIFVETVKRHNTVLAVAAVVTLILAFASPESVDYVKGIASRLPSWWPLALLGILFLYGMLVANYDQFQDVKKERDDLEKQIANDAKKRKVKDTLGEHIGHVDELMKRRITNDVEFDLLMEKAEEVYGELSDFITVEFSEGDARVVMSVVGPPNLHWEIAYSPQHERFLNHVRVMRERLGELLKRV